MHQHKYYFLDLFKRVVQIGIEKYEICVDGFLITYNDLKYFVFRLPMEDMQYLIFDKEKKKYDKESYLLPIH